MPTISFPPIPTKEIPQADSLEKVVKTVYAVSQGKQSHQEIARYLGVDDRQGRYYRKAAEILKLVTKTSSKNVSALTQIGQALLTSNDAQKKQLLINQVLGATVFQSVIGMVAASNGVSDRSDLENSLSKLVSPTTAGMIGRRLTTILSWLDSLDLAEKENHQVKLKSIPSSINKLEISDVRVPILPKPNELRLFEEVHQRKRSASALIKFEIDRAKYDRANSVHERLRSLLADKIRSHGAIPTWNKYVDLAVRMNNQDFLIEVKTSEHARGQVRRGLSQLYEYRYLQALPKAALVLLLEKPLSGPNQWLLEYLTVDRGISVIWDNSGDQLFTTDDGVKNLPFIA